MIDIYKCFNITSKHASVFLDEKISKFELCSGHRVFVKRIYENPGITRDQIKNIAHVHASNVTRAIDYMEEKGYITKVLKEDDKRICLLFPTEKLKEVYDVLIEAEKEWTSIITEGLTEEELAMYKKFLSISTELSVKYVHKK
jgi:DNA-binding MarR family transcriptional regulator